MIIDRYTQAKRLVLPYVNIMFC